MKSRQKLVGIGLTFDDVLVIPRLARVLPNEVDLRTRFSRRIDLNIPLVSAAMDTVTEHALAIALARQGGIGVLQRRLPIDEQAEEVRKVKRSQAWMIVEPVTLPPTATVGDARTLVEEQGISGIPIVEGKQLVGLITARDLRLGDDDPRRPIHELMRTDVVTAPEGTTPADAKRVLHEHRIEKLLIVNGDDELVGLITFKDLQNELDFPAACRDAQGRLRVAAAVGVHDGLERAAALVEAGADALVVDSAHGHSQPVLELVRRLVSRSDVDVVAGNVATGAGAKALHDAGAAAIKVGMGPGASCTTRVVTGCGVPQVTALLHAWQALEESVPIIADGGVRYSGDIVKALAAGASSVMIGSLFAGTTESPSEEVILQGRRSKVYRGMGSVGAMAQGPSDRYGQTAVDRTKLVAEGVEGRVPYKGPLADLVFQLMGGLRQGMGVAGCGDLTELREETRFLRMTSAGIRESHPHDLIITEEAPNYTTLGG